MGRYESHIFHSKYSNFLIHFYTLIDKEFLSSFACYSSANFADSSNSSNFQSLSGKFAILVKLVRH